MRLRDILATGAIVAVGLIIFSSLPVPLQDQVSNGIPWVFGFIFFGVICYAITQMSGPIVGMGSFTKHSIEDKVKEIKASDPGKKPRP